MRGVFHRLLQAWSARRQRHKEALGAAKRLGSDQAAWAELFRREDWSPPVAGHIGRCGQCGARLDLTLVQCGNCGAEWRPNTRRSDLHRQIVAYGVAVSVSVAAGYSSSVWLHARFAAIQARGDFVNPEMVDTLASFSWVTVSVLMMIGWTYVIERLAPTGHWRTRRLNHPDGDTRRKKDARA